MASDQMSAEKIGKISTSNKYKNYGIRPTRPDVRIGLSGLPQTPARYFPALKNVRSDS
jgi:hypothetical protein